MLVTVPIMWGSIVFLVALAGISAYADDLVTFPELARSSGRIVSGWEAKEGQHPHQLSLRMVSNTGLVSSCGASIIHNEWALTAAHCTAQRVSLVIRAAVNLTLPFYIFESTEYYNHPLYNEALPGVVQPNDIGVIKLGLHIEYNELMKPIRIQRSADRDNNYDQVRLVASGWGRTWTDGDLPEILNWVYLRGVTTDFCRSSFSGSSIVQPSTVCALGYNDTTQSTCQGDSGGPLTVVDLDGQISIIGVASFVSSLGCHVDMPAGFVRPGYYHSWYTQVTGINFDWDYEISTTTTDVPTTEAPEVTGEPIVTETPDIPEATATTEAPEVTEATSTTQAPDTEESESSEELGRHT